MTVRRVVIDTNVLISAALIGSSPPAELVRGVLRCGRLFFSTATFAELETRLWRPKFDRYLTMETRKLLLHDLGSVADWVEPTLAARYSRHPGDDMFVHAAIVSNAALLVSGDRDLLDLGQVEGIAVLAPADALKVLATWG